MVPLRLLLAGAVTVAVLGCERPDVADRDARVPDTPELLEEEGAYPPELTPGFALAARKTAARSYQIHGWTDRADSVTIEVEDGHNVLFGPLTVPVEENRFHLGFHHEPTDRSHIFLYITDAGRGRLAVVPVDTARASTMVGPRERLEPEEALEGEMHRERGTSPDGNAMESPHVRLAWPQVREGGREGDPTILFTDPPGAEVELSFQPIRNSAW
jgi:hypothetical protein